MYNLAFVFLEIKTEVAVQRISITGDDLLFTLATMLKVQFDQQDVIVNDQKEQLIKKIALTLGKQGLLYIAEHFTPKYFASLPEHEDSIDLEKVMANFSWEIPAFTCPKTLLTIILNLVACLAEKAYSRNPICEFPFVRLCVPFAGEITEGINSPAFLSWVYLYFASTQEDFLFKNLLANVKQIGFSPSKSRRSDLKKPLFFEGDMNIVACVFHLESLGTIQFKNTHDQLFWNLLAHTQPTVEKMLPLIGKDEHVRTLALQALHALQKFGKKSKTALLREGLERIGFHRLIETEFYQTLQSQEESKYFLMKKSMVSLLILQRHNYNALYFFDLSRQYVLSLPNTLFLNGAQPDTAFKLAASCNDNSLETEKDDERLIIMFLNAMYYRESQALHRIISISLKHELLCMQAIINCAAQQGFIDAGARASLSGAIAENARIKNTFHNLSFTEQELAEFSQQLYPGTSIRERAMRCLALTHAAIDVTDWPTEHNVDSFSPVDEENLEGFAIERATSLDTLLSIHPTTKTGPGLSFFSSETFSAPVLPGAYAEDPEPAASPLM